MDSQQNKNNKKEPEQKLANIKLNEEQNRKLGFFITAPLCSADWLMKQLYTDDYFYETVTYAWVGKKDAKKLFLCSACKEVIKSSIGLINDKEFLQEVPNKHFFVDMHKHKIFIPMFEESGFLKKREELTW